MGRFIGRDDELARLTALGKKRSASLVVIRGRRRIGKSRLIKEFGKSMRCCLFSGLPLTSETTRQSQLNSFSEQMASLFQIPKLTLSSWHEAFWQLGQLTAKGRVLLALDEISWIGSKDPDFLGYLKNAWDLYFSCNSQLILILCGSVSNWIHKNILSSTGFVGRVSCDMELRELPIHEAIRFWGQRAERISPYEIFKVLSVTGGVPRYLEEIMPEYSAEQNIRNLCFDKSGLLFREFNQIFFDLFDKRANLYTEIVTSLSQGSKDLDDICDDLEMTKTGAISNYLRDLIHAGFVCDDWVWSFKTTKSSFLKKFRLSDNYLRFYLRYVLPNSAKIQKGMYDFSSLSGLPGWESTMGLQFENLAMNNPDLLFRALGLNRGDLMMYGPYFQRPTARQKGCQIDLLIQTRYRNLYLCEVKFHSKPVGLEVVEEMKKKADRLTVPAGFSKRLVLIYVNGVTHGVLESEDLDHLVDFSCMFTGCGHPP